MSVSFSNPILTGMRPDPSVCRVGKDFYLVNSTFEYFPAIPLYHSTDLIHWEQLGHVLTRESQLKLKTGNPNCIGIYAPTIRYNNGRFYCIVTNVGSEHYGGNFFVWTDDINGEWSDPVWLDFDGIDPSLFFDEDGRVYYQGTDSGIFICEIDIETGKRRSKKRYVWNGSGGNNPEGPHLYHIGAYYYLMIAEGGTEMCHMETIARSKTIDGPYEECPWNPILTNRGTEYPIKGVGHADLVEDSLGGWWAVSLCNRPLGYPFTHNMGRETVLMPVKWVDGWPVLGENGHVKDRMEAERPAGERTPDTGRYIPGSDMTDHFDGDSLHPSWNYIYNPQEGLVELTGKELILHGNEVPIWEDSYRALICRRQEHFDFEAEMTVTLDKTTWETMQEGAETGLSIYMNNRHHYEIVFGKKDGNMALSVRRQLGTMIVTEHITKLDMETVTLKLRGSRNDYIFSYKTADKAEAVLGSGSPRYLTTETGGCFTGNYIALYAYKTDAVIKEFTYKAVQQNDC